MYFKTIYDNHSMLASALRAIYSLKKQGIDDENLPGALIDKYPEKDVKLLTDDVKRLPEVEKNYGARDLLITALWALLYIKILNVPEMLMIVRIPAIFKLSYYFLGLSYYSLSLYLVYEEYKHSYNVVFFTLIFSLVFNKDYVADGGSYLFTGGALTPDGLKFILWFLLTGVSIYCAIRMNQIIPGNLFRLKRIVKKEGLDFSVFQASGKQEMADEKSGETE